MPVVFFPLEYCCWNAASKGLIFGWEEDGLFQELSRVEPKLPFVAMFPANMLYCRFLACVSTQFWRTGFFAHATFAELVGHVELVGTDCCEKSEGRNTLLSVTAGKIFLVPLMFGGSCPSMKGRS